MTEQTTKTIQEFYNKTPFPDYDLNNFNSKEELRLSAWPFAGILDRSIQQEASIIDVGTGTGQLSAYLSLRRKCVYGIDFSDSSLNKARALKEKLNLDSWHLKKVDIMDRKQVEGIGMKFDYVLCLGVLHHTEDARQAFKNILPLLKPNGHIAVGLYNKFGRIPLKMRIFLAKAIFKDNQKVKDWFIKMQIGDVKDKERARGWWNDQYEHVHETTHTVGEILRWFKENNIEFLQTIPSLDFFPQADLETAGVFNKDKRPNIAKRMVKQMEWLYKTHHEGGYWITFGKKQ